MHTIASDCDRDQFAYIINVRIPDAVAFVVFRAASFDVVAVAYFAYVAERCLVVEFVYDELSYPVDDFVCFTFLDFGHVETI